MRLKHLLSVFLMLITCAIGNVWGVTFSTSDTWSGGKSGGGAALSLTKSGVTVHMTSGYQASSEIRYYSGATLTISSTVGNITAVTFTYSNSNITSANPGTWTQSSKSWSGSATSIEFSNGGQVKITNISVTVASSYSVVWTINPAAGGTLSTTSGASTTVTPNSAYTYGDPAYSVTSGTASVSQSSNTFSATPSANCTIRINMIEKPKYTVTLKDDNDTRTQASYGASVTLPSREGCEGYTFAGWSTTNNTSWTTTAPTIINAGSYTPTANIDLYPVYTKSEGTSEQYKLVSTLTNGKDYIFVTRNTAGSGYAFSSAITTGTSVTIATSGSDKIVSGTPANSIIWTAATGWSLTTKDDTKTNKVLKINGNTFALDATGSTNLAWTTDYGLNGKSSGTTKYYLQCSNTGTFSKSTTTGSSTNRVWAYEKSGGSTTYYISVPNCCQPLGSINGSFF